MKLRKIMTVGAITLTVAMTGCKTVDKNHNTDQIKQLEAKIAKQNAELESVKSQYSTLQSKSAHVNTSAVSVDSSLLPPSAKAGECYSRVLIPATYNTHSKEVVKNNKSTKIEIVPAVYEMGEETVMVKEASETLTTIPATYKWAEETVMVSPESKTLISVPAVFGNESEQLLVKPAYTTWKRGRGPIEKIDNSTGEIMCLVDVPAEYKTITKRVVIEPAHTKMETIPAEYKTIKRKVIDEPARVVRTNVPAEYNTIKVKKLVSGPKENVIQIPAVYDTIVEQRKVTDAEMQWRPILCETNTTKDIVFKIQNALDSAGYNPGNIDGVLGQSTISALTKFQKANNLPSGQLTMAALKKLGVI